MSGELEKLLIRLEADTTQLRRALAQADGAVDRYAGNADRKLTQTERRFQSMSRNVSSALAGIGIYAAVREVGQLADAYTNMANRLNVVSKSAGDLEHVQRRVMEIAQETRLNVTDVAELYARYAFALKDAGKTTNEVLDFTKALNQAVVISGASTAEAAGALRQLSQGLAAAELRGQELNSVMEQMPVVADAIAQRLGVTTGELKKLAEQGKITREVVFEAMADAAVRFDEQFKKTTPSISQSFAQMTNSFLELGNASGIFDVLTKSMQGWAKIFTTVTGLIKGSGATSGAVSGPAAAATAAVGNGLGMLGAGQGLQGNIRGEVKGKASLDPWAASVIPVSAEEQLREMKQAWDELHEAQLSTLDDLIGDKIETAAAKMEALNAAVRNGSIGWNDYKDGVKAVQQQSEESFDAMLSAGTQALDSLFANNKTVATATALINTYQGITKALSAYPPPTSYAMAAAQAAMGFAQVRAIQSTNKSSSGGAAGGGAVAPTAGAVAAPQTTGQTLTVQGLSRGSFFTGSMVRELAEALIQHQRDGGKVVLA
jgi:tape measure domain-containing protein